MDTEALMQAPQLPPMLERPEGPVTLSAEQAYDIYKALFRTVYVLDASKEAVDELEDKQDAALALMASLITPS
ncbi:hypothetical protein [Streptosporangium sp. 'caverna']|uniref:hypothetical protein n=1 Tax=Streptosporangium sp. 'caverna' TaxID=2202249 RepID=UPI000D7DC05D|nr:hypothetical protein [Streptosporangium sp. 'caverna']AWS44520.1 hypothetical protein DKM19_27390 [Streptosporangium sp. 'caverna']